MTAYLMVNIHPAPASNHLSGQSIKDSSLGTEAVWKTRLTETQHMLEITGRRGGWEVSGGLKGGSPPFERDPEKLKDSDEELQFPHNVIQKKYRTFMSLNNPLVIFSTMIQWVLVLIVIPRVSLRKTK